MECQENKNLDKSRKQGELSIVMTRWETGANLEEKPMMPPAGDKQVCVFSTSEDLNTKQGACHHWPKEHEKYPRADKDLSFHKKSQLCLNLERTSMLVDQFNSSSMCTARYLYSDTMLIVLTTDIEWQQRWPVLVKCDDHGVKKKCDVPFDLVTEWSFNVSAHCIVLSA